MKTFRSNDVLQGLPLHSLHLSYGTPGMQFPKVCPFCIVEASPVQVETIIFFSSLMDNNPVNAHQENISSFRNSVTLLTSEWFVIFPGSQLSSVASNSLFSTGCFISPFQFLPMPTLWVSGTPTSAEYNLTDAADAYEGMCLFCFRDLQTPFIKRGIRRTKTWQIPLHA